jgi:2-polyprenyl-6-methoxyphenol hydroxylase-like FAD-dependent oxidoreductase
MRPGAASFTNVTGGRDDLVVVGVRWRRRAPSWSAVKVLVAGGGIGGLTAALAVRSAGADVEVLERGHVPGEVGAGLALWPNGQRALAALGIDQVPGLAVSRLEFRSRRGRLLTETPIGAFRARYGYELLMVHRAELHSSLLAALPPETIRLGSEVTAVEQDARSVSVLLASGERLRAELLIGADGLRSAVRRSLLADGEPRYSGATCWRGTATFEMGERPSLNWWGRGGEFGLFPLPGGRIYWFGVLDRPERQADGPKGRRADVLQAFGSWPEPVAAVVQATEEGDILRNDLYDRPPTRAWGRGRVTLLGDAAHPMLPNAAQGACQALEDAVALGAALAAEPSERALAAYEASRLRRANGFVSQSRRTARLVQAKNPVAAALRDLAVAHLPRSVLLSQLDATMQFDRTGRDDSGPVPVP